jgi:phosphotransferase system enzyme I (PtsI)
MGLRHFSMNAAQLLSVKQHVMTADVEQLTVKVSRLLRLEEPDRIHEMLEKINAA